MRPDAQLMHTLLDELKTAHRPAISFPCVEREDFVRQMAEKHQKQTHIIHEHLEMLCDIGAIRFHDRLFVDVSVTELGQTRPLDESPFVRRFKEPEQTDGLKDQNI